MRDGPGAGRREWVPTACATIYNQKESTGAALIAAVMGAPFKRVHDLSENRVDWMQPKEGILMPRAKKHSAEEIIPKLRTAELEIAKGRTATEAAKKIGVTEQTYYRWRKEYGGLRTDQAKRLKELEKENSRLKRLLADAELDKAILREAASGNF
jgi:putative transposase